MGLDVVVDPVGVGQEAQGVGDRLQDRTEGVGRAAQVPTEAPGRDAAQDHAALPRTSHRRVDAVQSPEREQVRHRSAADPHEVAAAEAFVGVGRGLREELQLGDVAAGRVERLVEDSVVHEVVAGRGVHEADARPDLVGDGEGVEQHGAESRGHLHRTLDEAARGGEDSWSFHPTVLTHGPRATRRAALLWGSRTSVDVSEECHGHE